MAPGGVETSVFHNTVFPESAQVDFSRDSYVTLDMAMNVLKLGLFKTRTKKIAAQVECYLYLNAILSPELLGT